MTFHFRLCIDARPAVALLYPSCSQCVLLDLPYGRMQAPTASPRLKTYVLRELMMLILGDLQAYALQDQNWCWDNEGAIFAGMSVGNVSAAAKIRSF